MNQLPAAYRLPSRMKVQEGGAVEEKGTKWNQGNKWKEDPPPAVDLLDDMTLSQFRESGLVLVIRCEVLGEEVVWAADNTPEARRGGFDDKGRVIYSGEELRILHAFSSRKEDLVAYHSMRKAVGRVDVVSLTYEPQVEAPAPSPREEVA